MPDWAGLRPSPTLTNFHILSPKPESARVENIITIASRWRRTATVAAPASGSLQNNGVREPVFILAFSIIFSLTCDVKTSRVLQRADIVCTVQGLGIMELAVTLPCVAPMFIPALF